MPRTRWVSRLAAICALLALAVVATACGGSNSGSSTSSTSSGSSGSTAGGTSTGTSTASGGTSNLPPTITATFVGDLTGPVAYVGKQEQLGMKLAVDQINSSGMLGNSKLKLTMRDTGSDQATAVTQFSQAAKDDNVSAIFGPLLSNEALATAPIAQREQVPDIATQSQNPGLLDTGEWIYRLTTSQLRYDNLIVNHVAEKGAKTVKLIYANDNPTLVDVSTKFMPDSFSKVGVKVTDNIGIPTATTDFSSLVTKLTAGNPDGIGLMLVGSALPSLTKALRTAGYKGMLFADSAATAGVMAPAGSAADGLFYAVDFTADLASKYPSSKKFVDAFKKAYPKDTPYGYNASAYDAVNFLALSIKASGDASRAGILKGMQMVSQGQGFDGAAGPTKFADPDHRDVVVPGALVEWRNGAEHLLQAGDPSVLEQPVKKP